MSGSGDENLKTTPLHDLHLRLGGRMVGFAGYALPVQYPAGILAEHRHCRSAAALFDVSHMGQVRIEGPGAAEALERLVPASLAAAPVDRYRYTQFTTPSGGMLDDLMAARREDHLFLVVNAGCKDRDLAHLRDSLGQGLSVELLEDRALLALQGPQAAAVLSRLAPDLASLPFLALAEVSLDGVACLVSRSGYTGEDGFEIALPGDKATALAERLLAEPEVDPAGLGARDSLRLEAGLPLYGHELSEEITPVEAGLSWSIPKSRRLSGGFPGAEVILRQLAEGAPRRRIGLKLEERAPARDGAPVLDEEGRTVGVVTSGAFGPTVEAPVALALVEAAAAGGASFSILVRDRPRAARAVPLPFVPTSFYRG